jgi:hypothetical protein
MALPLTGITTTIVSQAIGLASNSVNALCNNYKINKWSKFKPVRYDNVAPNRGVGADWWRANDGNCGLSIPSYQNMSAMFNALRGGANDWNYLPPTGVAGQPLRLADFRGYDAEATPPYSITALKDTYYIGIDNLDAVLSAKTSNPGGLLLSDLGYSFNLADMYLGVSFVRNGFTNYAYLTATQKANASGGSLVSTPTTGMAAGTYEVALFFAEFSKLLTAPDIANTFIPIPGSFQTVEIKSGVLGVYFGGGTYWNSGEVYFQIIFNNTTNQGQTLNKCYIDIKYGDNIDGPSQVGEASFKIHTPGQADGIVYAPGNATTTISDSLLGVLPDFETKGGYIKFTTSTNDAYNTGVQLYAVE